MRISDWSSDVCSSDLLKREPGGRRLIEGDRLVQLALKVLEAAAKRAPRHAILKSLSDAVGETCNLGVLAGHEMVYLDRVEAQWPLGLRFEPGRSEEHTSELQSLMRISYAVFCLKTKTKKPTRNAENLQHNIH